MTPISTKPSFAAPNVAQILANRFKLLAEPARLQILAALCIQELNVQDICTATGLSQANVSKHLQLLKWAGVVSCRQVGTWRYYQVADPELLDLCHQTSRRYYGQQSD